MEALTALAAFPSVGLTADGQLTSDGRNSSVSSAGIRGSSDQHRINPDSSD